MLTRTPPSSAHQSSNFPPLPPPQPPEKLQLFINKNAQLLEDAKKLAEAKVENDDILALAIMQEGRCSGSVQRVQRGG